MLYRLGLLWKLLRDWLRGEKCKCLASPGVWICRRYQRLGIEMHGCVCLGFFLAPIFINEEGQTYESREEELVPFGNVCGDVPGGPAKLGEDGFFSLFLITILLDGSNNTLLVDKDSSIVPVFQLIKSLAMNECAYEETLSRDWRHDKSEAVLTVHAAFQSLEQFECGYEVS